MRLPRFPCRLILAVAWMSGGGDARAAKNNEPPEVKIGERLFLETRFAQRFFASAGGDPNIPTGSREPALGKVQPARFGAAAVPGPFADGTMNCRACHLVDELKTQPALPGRGVSAYADFGRRSPLPVRPDQLTITLRNSPALVDVVGAGAPLLHFDGEFATVEELIKATYTGRNFGWRPEENAVARRQFARVIRQDRGRDELAEDYGRLSYPVILRGTDPKIPAALRLPERFRFDPATATDDEILDRCARLVAAYLESLRFARDRDGWHNGSPYDAFLAANNLPRGPAPGEEAGAYARRLQAGIAALTAPRFVDEPSRPFKYHGQPFRFGELEWRGMQIFFRGATDEAEVAGAGNCAACHRPPRFTDFAFHNTGATQDDFDALNGAGAFVRLFVPTLGERDTSFDAWLPATPRHPEARGPFQSAPSPLPPPRTDLGLWNVYANPDLPGPQPAIERLLNPDGRLDREAVLRAALARFKTPGLRDLGQTLPYLHTGRFVELEEVIRFYQRMSRLARAGTMRNAPPEFAAMRLGADDFAPLVAFLKALNEDYD